MPASGKLLLSDMVANVRKFMGENAPSDDCAVYTRVASAMGRFGEGFSAPDFAKVIGPHGFPENSILLGSTNKGPVFLLASPKTFQEKVYGRKSSPSVALFAGSNARWVPLSTPRTKIGTPSVGFTWGNVMRVAGQIAIFGSLDYISTKNMAGLEVDLLWGPLSKVSDKTKVVKVIEVVSEFLSGHSAYDNKTFSFLEKWCPPADDRPSAEKWVDFTVKYNRPPMDILEITKNAPHTLSIPRYGVTLQMGVTYINDPVGSVKVSGPSAQYTPITFEDSAGRAHYFFSVQIERNAEGNYIDTTPYKKSWVKGFHALTEKLSSVNEIFYEKDLRNNFFGEYEELSGYILNAHQTKIFSNLIGEIKQFDYDPVNNIGIVDKVTHIPFGVPPEKLFPLLATYGVLTKSQAVQMNAEYAGDERRLREKASQEIHER